MFRLTILIFFIVATFITPYAQQQLSPNVISSGGGFIHGDSYSLSYTFGEAAVKTYTSNSFILTEGFQQGHFSALNPRPPADTKVFPNPVVNNLFINIVSNESKNYLVTIYSISGKAIVIVEYSGSASGYFKTIDVSNFVKGLYFVKIEAMDGSLQRTFKIEKL